ncbi:SIR2 family protein [Enterococcus sp. DIV0800]|uniref:SIR2 family protein n=1 Tax=unclassified Enterococcus TaxID=2608891 RepID=UPI003D2FB63B
MSVFNELVQSNTYPIVFIGSGISKRYLKNFPSWLELLEQFWSDLDEKEDFFSYLTGIRESLPVDLNKAEKNFRVNVLAAKNIHRKFNLAFRQNKVTIPNLTSEDVFKKSIDPFKYSIAQKFSSTDLQGDIDEDEYSFFCDMLVNSKIIVTTNYDQLVEHVLEERNNPAKVFIGQKGFFDPYEDWGELYKVHGSITDSSSIVIDEDDYTKYDENSILISAKLLSNMIHSPIIFLGYSLTDRNIVKLLSDFSSQIPKEDLRKTANRIVVVEYDKDNMALDEKQIYDRDSNMSYTHIMTDNYKEIFSQLAKIDEGLTPYEVRKFNSVIKKLVIATGQKGSLDAVLLSPTELENISEQIDQGKPIVLALGDTKHIFVNPTPVSYLEDYVLEKGEIMPENALRFVSKEGVKTKYPFIKHYRTVNLKKSSLEDWEIERLNKKIDELSHTTIKGIISTINEANRIKDNSITNIMNLKVPLNKRVDMITYNATSFNFNDFSNYVKGEALHNFIKFYKARNTKDGLIKSAYRKLFCMWDILNYKEIEKSTTDVPKT